MELKCAWIFVNGGLGDPNVVKNMILPGDLLVAADGGYSHLRQLHLLPDVLIGDLDSIPEADAQWLAAQGVRIERFSPDKDETDLELALLWVIAAGWRRIRIAAAQGDRLDHTLGNLFLLLLPELENCDVRLENGLDEVFFIRTTAIIRGHPGDRVSLLPFGKPAEGVSTRGLQYALCGETLLPERTRGISNVLLEDSAEVSISAGLLICIHTRLSSPEK